ncbi:MAG: hypothetical protein D6776_00515, partial [Planctomycetota bacterium]
DPSQPAQVWPPNNAAGPWPKIRYEITLRPANFPVPGGMLSAVDTPVLQEVGLSWYLPTPEVLLRERIVD